MAKVWKARWIMDKIFYGMTPINVFHKQSNGLVLPEHKPELKNHHMLIRKKFHLNKAEKNVILNISADDYYKLYVNNRFVGQGPAPSYYFNYYYNRYDISEYLIQGDNVIAVHVYYQGLINRVWNSGDYRQGLIAELYVDGELLLGSDSSWRYIRAKEYVGASTFGYETQFVEDIDCRLKEKHWKEIDFDDQNWEFACEHINDDHKLVLQPTPILDVYEIKPQIVKILKNGNYLLDFGQEITGQFKMEATGLSGQEILIMYGEELEDGGGNHVRHQLRCNCDYKDTWTLSGDKDLLEQYDYKAFRYLEISAPKGTVDPATFCAVVRHYPLDETKCKFHTSNQLLNDIWNMCKNGVKYCSQEVYVDCPSREKGQYLGDATVTTHAHLYLSGDLRLFKKALKDFALSAYICPGIMAVAPGSFMQEIADFSLQWPLQLLNYYRQSGDIDFLIEMAPIAEGILKYFHKYKRKDGLLENVKEKWNLVDWPQNLRDNYDFDLSDVVGDGCHNVINAFYCGAVKTVNEIRDVAGIKYEDEFPKLKEAFIKAFYREDIKLFADSTISNHTSLHSNMLPLFFGLVPNGALNSIVDLIKDKRLNCGVYNTYFLLKGLAAAGEYELVYDLITSQDERSWANMLREGATTCFEVWGKDQKWNTSLCHAWASSPIPVIIEDILGLKPGKSGWEEVEFNPHIPESLKEVYLEIHTVRGPIVVSYKNGVALWEIK